MLNLKNTPGELYKILGWSMFIWYACLRWYIQTNTLGTFVLNSQGNWDFVLSWIFAPINMATAFLSIYFANNILSDFDRSFSSVMYRISWLLLVRNGWYTYEDYKDYIHLPTPLQFLFIAVDIAMFLYVLIWLFIYWSKRNGRINRIN